MTGSAEVNAEQYLRYSQRSHWLGLLLSVGTEAAALLAVFRPESGVERFVVFLPVLFFPVLIMLWKVVMPDKQWKPIEASMQAAVQDEWGLINRNRAICIALVVVLIAQLPIAFFLLRLPTERALVGMAASTVTLALATFCASYLFLTRDGVHGG